MLRAKSDPKFNNDEASRTLILNKLNEHIKEHHLKQYFEAKFKVAVERIQLSREKPMIVFSKEILETGFLKAAFKLGLRSRMSRYKKLQEDEYAESKQFRSSIMSDPRQKSQSVVLSYDEAREMLEAEELRRPNHLFELRFETISKDSFVDFE
jgi:sugar diacid utilization regulator